MAINVPSAPYPAPPIVEAIVQVLFADPLPKTLLTKSLKRLRAGYEHEAPVHAVGVNVDFDNLKANFEPDPQTRLSSSDEADILLVHPKAYTWSRLAPYEGWEALISRVKRDFDVSHGVSGFRKVDRLGVRFVNRLDVPRASDDVSYYEDFLTIHLTLPDLMEPHNRYGWRVERNFKDDGLVAIMQSADGVAVIPGTDAFILDIDIACSERVPAKVDGIFECLGKMRVLKNKLFELSITDKARVAFQ